jgi:CHAT domain-containing protein
MNSWCSLTAGASEPWETFLKSKSDPIKVGSLSIIERGHASTAARASKGDVLSAPVGSSKGWEKLLLSKEELKRRSSLQSSLEGKGGDSENKRIEQLENESLYDPSKGLILGYELALYYLRVGNFSKAEDFALRGARYTESFFGRGSKQHIICLLSLTKIYAEIHDVDQLEKYSKRALDVLGGMKAPRLDFQVYALVSRTRAKIDLGAFDAAKQTLQSARSCAKEAPLLNALLSGAEGDLAVAQGDFSGAAKCYQKAMADAPVTTGTNALALLMESPNRYLVRLFNCLVRAGFFNEARELEPKINLYLSNESEVSVDRFGLYADRAVLEKCSAKLEKADAASSEYIRQINRIFPMVLRMPEAQRLAWSAENLRMGLPIGVDAPNRIAECVFRWKGIVLDSLSEDKHALQRSLGRGGDRDIERLRYLRRELSKAEIASARSGGKKATEIESLRDEAAKVERDLARRATALGESVRALAVTPAQISSELPLDAALVDFICYSPVPDCQTAPKRYGAVVLSKNGTPIWTDLGDATSIESLISEVRGALGNNGNEEALLRRPSTELFKRLIEPLLPKLETNITQFIVSPDGALNFLAFAALLDSNDRFLGERFAISYVGSARDLLKKTSSPNQPTIILYSDPDFSRHTDKSSLSKEGPLLATRSLDFTQFSQAILPQLPGTVAEAEQLRLIAQDAHWSTDERRGARATKASIVALKSPTVLHLATHGFFLSQTGRVESGKRGLQLKAVYQPEQNFQAHSVVKISTQNAMRQSAIALAGAQTTLKSWALGEVPDPLNDGILTAEEVAGLDFDGTWLVTLSACETGVGEVRSGEGVFGLRRAFIQAGAQNLLLTLWAVNDEITSRIMADFYRRALRTRDAAHSLASTQRDWLVKLREEQGLLAAVRYAAPFVMATTGKPAAVGAEGK